MDERHQQIRENAGLDESKLNQDFIDFIKKYTTPVIVVILLIVAGFWGWNKYSASRERAVADAFGELESAQLAGKPENLLAVAEQHSGYPGIAEMAKLYAADAYLDCFRSGVKPMSPLDDAGKPKFPEDVLDEKGKEEYLTKANTIYDAVVNRTSTKKDQLQFTVGGLFGLAAVAECRRDMDMAKGFYVRIKSVAGTVMPEFAEVADKRLQTMALLAELPRLYRSEEIPVAKPAAMPAGGLVPLPGPPPGFETPVAPTDDGDGAPSPTVTEPEPVKPPVTTPPTPPDAAPPASPPAGVTPPTTPPAPAPPPSEKPKEEPKPATPPSPPPGK